MGWLVRKFDRLIGTVIAALVGLGTSQLLTFIQQYRQRLGGHLAEAERNLRAIATDETFSTLDAASRARLNEAAAARVEDLRVAYEALGQASAFGRPVAFFQTVDRDIAIGTLMSFQPALPLDASSIVYGLIGIVLGLVVYDLLKSPVRLVRRRR